MPIYRKRPRAQSYGQAVGILLLDAKAPLIPGDTANASSYEFPVLFRNVPGLTTTACLGGEAGWESAVVEAAKELQAEGVQGISSDCGFMIQFQDAVAEALDIPVALSSLLQLPMVARAFDPDTPIGIITADSSILDSGTLARYGLSVPNPLVIAGMQDEAEFDAAIMQAGPQGAPCMSLDSDKIQDEVVTVARGMIERNPAIGAILLECSVLPAYAKAVQDAVGLPCYDFLGMIHYMEAGTRQRRYAGGY